MSMKGRVMVIVALGLLVLGVLVLGYVYLSMNRPSGEVEENPQGGNPFGFPLGGNPGESKPMRTIDGQQGSLMVPDFTVDKEPIALSEDQGDVQYELTPYPAYEIGKPYVEHAFDIQFNERESLFVVTLNKEPLKASRLEAEAFLRTELKLSDAQLCELNSLVGVPYSVNQTLSNYQNLGLSFCPNAYPLP